MVCSSEFNFFRFEFDLGELSRAGDVYSTSSNGGKLSYLKVQLLYCLAD